VYDKPLTIYDEEFINMSENKNDSSEYIKNNNYQDQFI